MKVGKPIITIHFQNESFKVLKIIGQSGDAISSHKVDHEALLQVNSGSVIYEEANTKIGLEGDALHPIPKNVLHELKFITTSQVLLFLIKDTKMTFSKSS